jgi:hypothetical protein
MTPALENALVDVCDFMEANPNCTQKEIRRQMARIRSKHAISREDFSNALKDRINSLKAEQESYYEEIYGCTENDIEESDVEGAAIAIWALNLAHPDHDDNEYLDERSRILDQYCPLLKLSDDEDFPHKWQLKLDEMLNMIFDAAERLEAGVHLPV